MEQYIDPITIRNEMLSKVEENIGYDIVTPTTPFVALLNSITNTQSSFRDSLLRHESRMFPSIASNLKDVYHKVTSDNDIDLFSSPASCELTLSIDIDNALANSIYDETTSTFYFSLEANTSVEVDGITLTIPNRITCSLYIVDSMLTESAEFSTVNPTFFKNIGKLTTTITYNDDNKPLMNIIVPTIQVKHKQYTSNVVSSNDFDVKIDIEDEYYYTRVETTLPNGDKQELKIVYVDDRYDPDIPSAFIGINDDSINIKIPRVYIDKGLIGNEVLITAYTTKGKMLTHLSEYKPESFSITFAKSADKYVVATKNITVLVSSNDILRGGSNKSDFRTIKNKIIDSTSGIIKIPNTEKQLKEKIKLSGYTIFKDLDNILSRVYNVTTDKNVESKSSDGVNYPAIYTIKPSVVIDDVANIQDTVVINKKYLIIKPNTIFNNKLLSKTQYNVLTSLTALSMINELNKNKYTYTPYLTITDNNTEDTSSRVFDILTPELSNIRIKSYNKNTLTKCNITGYNIFKKDSGYGILFRVAGNNNYSTIANNIKIQIKLNTITGGGVYLVSKLDLDATKSIYPEATAPLHYIDIKVDDYITKENTCKILNGYAPYDRDVMISSIIDIIVYSTDISNANNDALSYIQSDKILPSNANVLALTEETLDFKPIKRLEYLSSSIDSSYIGRRYEVYNEDIPARYTTDIYEATPTGCGYKLTDTDGNGKPDEITRTKIHDAGDIMLDNVGKPVIKHKKGDIIYNGDKPIEVGSLGIKRIMEIITLDYKYKYINTPVYKNAINKTIEDFNDSLLNDIPKLNEDLMDNTILKLVTRRTLDNCITTNNEEIPFDISPVIKVFISKDTKLTDSPDNLKNIIGNILSRYLSKLYINLEDIESAIANEINSIYGVQIKNISPSNDRVFYLKPESNRLTLKKVIDDNFNIVYDIKLEIISI